MQKNLNYKKELSQRQLEKMKKAEVKEVKEVKVEEVVKKVEGPIEEPKTEEEKKVFPILDAMGIEHVDVVGMGDA